MRRNNAYLNIWGQIDWKSNSATSANAPYHEEVSVTFNSMSLPNLSPQIYDVALYRADGTLIDKENDYVQPGDKVQVRCTVRNSNSAAAAGGFNEQYPMHVKLTNTDEHPTQGLTPFVDADHRVEVRNESHIGESTQTSKGDNAIDGANGVPVVLVGTQPTTVSWWAEVSGGQGGAVKLSQELIEDSFQGRQYSTVELVDERPLEPAPDGVDPSDPDSGAGTAWHYTRLPAANENGWNSSAVALRFYPGSYDSMELTPSGQTPVTLTAASPEWKQEADTAGVELSGQAHDSSTGAISTQRAGKVKIDSTAPRLTLDPALGTLAVDDPGAVASGIWRLHRTDSSGTVASSARASSVFRDLKAEGAGTGSGADWAGPAAVPAAAVPNGYYVAEDAAGNRSTTPVKVGATEPPSVERPPGSIVDPDDPNPPTPVGPPVGPGDDVPAPTVTEDGNGLKHAVINETITEMIDPAAPPFGGSLDAAKATALLDYRYADTSTAQPTTKVDELLDASGGGALAALDTTQPGACLIRRVITDDQGNTTTINLHYKVVRDNCPVVRPLEPVNPDDPTGPTQPGDPLTPDGPVTTRPDGTQAAEVSCDVTEAVTHGTMGAAGADALLRRHFDLAGAAGDGVTVTVQSMKNAAGNQLAAIDLSRVADYAITYLVRDGDGNTTTVRMGYHLVNSHVPGVVVTPDPGDGHTPLPGEDPLNPQPRPLDPPDPPRVAPDGTQHADVYDTMRVPVQPGAELALPDARSLVQHRYTFTPEGGGAMTELSLALAGASGSTVSSIDRSRPGAWDITYRVADASGNTVTVHLRYVVVAEAPSITPAPDDGSSDDPAIPGATRPGGSDPDKPLKPVSETVDPDTGLVHAVVEDTVLLPTAAEPVTPTQMVALIGDFYQALATGNGSAAAGPVALFDSAGNPVSAIDRTVPGSWRAETLFADVAGNTTLLRLFVKVIDNHASGSMGAGDNGNGSGGAGNDSGNGAGSGSGSGRFSTAVHQLPQTGGLFGPCPLHILFVLMALVASSYSLMRLRSGGRGSARRDERRSAAVSAGGSAARGDGDGKRFRYTALDGLVHGIIFCCTMAMALLHFCPFDGLFALAVVMIEAAWIWLMLNRSSHTDCNENPRPVS